MYLRHQKKISGLHMETFKIEDRTILWYMIIAARWLFAPKESRNTKKRRVEKIVSVNGIRQINLEIK